MESLPEHVELVGIPVHIQSWSVARIPGFIPAILHRWQRARARLPEHFTLVLCPQAEINVRGGLPARVHELTDPRLTCRHFTGCTKPYFAAIFSGADADRQRVEVQSLLPWSEGYKVSISAEAIRLEFAGASEELDDMHEIPRHTVQELLASGELLKILE